jgi:hypothetical protein
MKNIILILTTFCFGLTGLHAQNIYSERKPGLMDKEYETFAFLDQNGKKGMNEKELLIFENPMIKSIWVYDDPMFQSERKKATIKESIKQGLIDNGMKADKMNADAYVSYTIFKENGKLTGSFVDKNENAFPNATESIDVDKGTLFVTLLDSDSGEMLWQGFKNGAISKNSSDNELIKAVTDILDRFTLEYAG